VQLDVASRPGVPLRAPIRGQNRPANQFQLGWADNCIEWYSNLGRGDGFFPGLRPNGEKGWYCPPDPDPGP
jgi:hypothetical protein